MSALIRFLANPSSDLRAAAFLRSRFVRLSDDALAPPRPAIGGGAHRSGAAGQLDGARRDRPARAGERHARSVPGWIPRVDRVPPADLIEQVLPETAYAYELRGARSAQAWENVKKMRGLIRRIQNRGYATLARIADHLDSLTAGDESNAVLEAIDAVNLMTVHAAKGLEFPVVFVVNLARGASGPPKPVRITGDDVSIGPFVSDTDDEEKLREREETKRLMYVAVTRARDRLYLASLIKNGVLIPGRGSLADVLPESVRALFNQAAAAGAGSVAWSAASGRTFELRVCADSRDERPRVPSASSPAARTMDALTPWPDTGPTAVRESVTAGTSAEGLVSDPAAEDSRNALAGTLVHRLFQYAASLQDDASLDEVAERAQTLLRADERAMTEDPVAVCRQAAHAWRTIRRRPEVRELLETGDRRYEVPFSVAAAGSSRSNSPWIDRLPRPPAGRHVHGPGDQDRGSASGARRAAERVRPRGT